MNTNNPLPLLGGLSPETFMRRYWQKKPLLIRGAIPGFKPLLSRSDLIELSGQEGVESRLVVKHSERSTGSKPATGRRAAARKLAPWTLSHGPFDRRGIPPFKQPDWTLLVQGVDLHVQSVHELMCQFRFVPDARLDDLMISYATDGGGVGPHFDSYDVFLLQAHGRRKWRIGRQKDFSLEPDVPLKILSHFEPEEEHVLEPGDMLYLPPRWAHDGVAEGECMTYSVGFRTPAKSELAQELLQRIAEDAQDSVSSNIYRDPGQVAMEQSAQIPAAFLQFSQEAVQAALADKWALPRALGEHLTEPKANVWFDSGAEWTPGDVRLHRRTRMLFDERHVFINGESFVASGRDATLMRSLANQRFLPAKDVARLSAPALDLLAQWCEDGWVVSGD